MNIDAGPCDYNYELEQGVYSLGTIALATQLPLPSDCESFDDKKWPGSKWIKYFKKICASNGFELKRAQDVPADAQGVYWIQEEFCQHGVHLKHADKVITFCLESVIYAADWYKYKKDMGFNCVLEFGSRDFYFPSFDPSEVVEDPQPRDKDVCMIISNKHYRGFNITPPISQLHDYRYQVIDWAKKNHGMDLYGMGWGEFAQPVEDKLETLKQYKSTIIIENDARPYYFTEKFVHAMVAGCQPIYYGDPNAYSLKSAEPAHIEKSLTDIKHSDDYDDFLYWRKRWLEEESHKYTYEFFAEQMFERFLENKK
jgi:hypothetical protein